MSIIAKSVILDIADNYGGSHLGIRQVDFLFLGELIEITTEFSAYATSFFDSSGMYVPAKTFDTSTFKTGSQYGTQWLSDAIPTAQRLIIVFDVSTEFDQIVINNAHSEGGSTNFGAQNVVITASTDVITDTTYNATITNPTVLFTEVFDQHVAVDVEDPQTVYFEEVNRGVFISPQISIVSTGDVAPYGIGVFAAPLVDVISEGAVYHYSGHGDIDADSPDVAGYGFITHVVTGNIEVVPVSVSGTGAVTLMGAGHVSSPKVRIDGNYGALGNVDALPPTGAGYGRVSLIGHGMMVPRKCSVHSVGQLSLIGTTRYRTKLPEITSIGQVLLGSYGKVIVSPPAISSYGYISTEGIGDVVAGLPQIVCRANQPDDYTVIKHSREGICH